MDPGIKAVATATGVIPLEPKKYRAEDRFNSSLPLQFAWRWRGPDADAVLGRGVQQDQVGAQRHVAGQPIDGAPARQGLDALLQKSDVQPVGDALDGLGGAYLGQQRREAQAHDHHPGDGDQQLPADGNAANHATAGFRAARSYPFPRARHRPPMESRTSRTPSTRCSITRTRHPSSANS